MVKSPSQPQICHWLHLLKVLASVQFSPTLFKIHWIISFWQYFLIAVNSEWSSTLIPLMFLKEGLANIFYMFCHIFTDRASIFLFLGYDPQTSQGSGGGKKIKFKWKMIFYQIITTGPPQWLPPLQNNFKKLSGIPLIYCIDVNLL